MKNKNVIKTVKCEMCDNTQADKSEFRAPHGHTMIVVSIWDDKEKKRQYMDFCSKECVAKWSNCTEPDRASCPRLCQDFCNQSENENH